MFGRGTWERSNRKPLVENCASIDVRELIQASRHRPISYSVMFKGNWFPLNCQMCQLEDDRLALSIEYNLRGVGDIEYSIPLQSTFSTFGVRRWFSCPIGRGDASCGKRCSKLYLPIGGKYFGCRNCYGLVYRSCQTAHSDERLTNLLCEL
jgi:hypothetical protein